MHGIVRPAKSCCTSTVRRPLQQGTFASGGIGLFSLDALRTRCPLRRMRSFGDLVVEGVAGILASTYCVEQSPLGGLSEGSRFGQGVGCAGICTRGGRQDRHAQPSITPC